VNRGLCEFKCAFDVIAGNKTERAGFWRPHAPE
jgi:hypothetical protein